MDLELEGRTAVVVGSSRGIGKATARGLSAEGCSVVLGSRDETELTRAAVEIEAETGRPVHALPIDVTDPASLGVFVHSATDRLGGCDILVNCSGAPPYRERTALTDDDWAAAGNRIFTGARQLTEAFLPGMRKRRWGRVLFVLSSTVRQPGFMLLNAHHAGLAAYAKALANEVAPDNVLVNSVCPAFVDTERLEALAESYAASAGTTPEEAMVRWMRSVPLGRPAAAREVADLLVFLASARASYLTGRAFDVDGGFLGGVL